MPQVRPPLWAGNLCRRFARCAALPRAKAGYPPRGVDVVLASGAPIRIQIDGDSRAQAASVIGSPALPPGLADAIWREAQSQAWAPADPMVTPAAKEIVVNADPFFGPAIQPPPRPSRP